MIGFFAAMTWARADILIRRRFSLGLSMGEGADRRLLRWHLGWGKGPCRDWVPSLSA
jgi:hypothetical protein